MTDELKAKITEIIHDNREIDSVGWVMLSEDIADKIAEVVDAEIVRALRLNDIKGTPLGEILDELDMEIRSKT
jgi:hypothetical protein